MADSRKVRWGILSTANIGVQKVIPGILKSPHSEVVAIASRDLGRAHTALSHLGLRSHARAYGSYEELFADPNVDAIYNPLPNHLHVPMTLAAAKAGKHVLCEKPIALNAAEAEQLRQCPPDRIVAEAFMVRYHPQWQRAREIVRSGELGELRAIRAVFSYYNTDPDQRAQPGRHRRRRHHGHRLLSGRRRPLPVRGRAAAGRLAGRSRPQLQDRPAGQRHRRFRRRPAAELRVLHPDGAAPVASS